MSSTRGATAYGRGAGAYARVGVESATMSANPHRLIVMLFDGALGAIRAARIHIEAGNTSEKGKSISKALEIVNSGLAAALDIEKGGEIAERLASLYDYIARLLLSANLHNDVESLNQAERLLDDIASAWREIGTAEAQG
ncbi:flagellar export chaperone FliS [Halomonas faecis]|uniref:flagellar export chaperone FliS n=1 Tax=Halomonas faecis TaxID=1562110 RepID=UPI0013D39674|nr:flagellar export chaperone FliS [Halomonas faecis]